MSFVRFTTEEHRARRDAEKASHMRGLLIPSRSAGSYTGRSEHAPQPKGETARPGKRPPTVEERKWMDAIVRYGCVACRVDGNGPVTPQVHHILRGGRRMGHLFTLPLCLDHHQDTGRPGFTARHPWKTRWERLYGAEMDVLERLRAEIGAIAHG